jgi:hypothetical protein
LKTGDCPKGFPSTSTTSQPGMQITVGIPNAARVRFHSVGKVDSRERVLQVLRSRRTASMLLAWGHVSLWVQGRPPGGR